MATRRRQDVRRWGRSGQWHGSHTGRPLQAYRQTQEYRHRFWDRAVAAAPVSFPTRCLCVCCFLQNNKYTPVDDRCTGAHPQPARIAIDCEGDAEVGRCRWLRHGLVPVTRRELLPAVPAWHGMAYSHRAIDDRRTTAGARNTPPSHL